jgi:hypothetical protein
MLIPNPTYLSPTSLSQQTCNGFLQSTLSFYYIHFLHPNTNINIISGILTWPKQVPLNGATSYNGTQDTILVNAKASVLRFMPSSLT